MKTNAFLRLSGLLTATCFGSLICNAQVPVRIMPLGDSLTDGYHFGTATNTVGGYRKLLQPLLTAPSEGYAVDFVGTLNDAVATTEGWDGDHEGHPGFRIQDIQGRVAFWLKQAPDPDVVLLNIGTNDFWIGSSLLDTQNRMRDLIEEIATLRPHARIIVSTLTPRTDSFAGIQEDFNEALVGIVNQQAALGRNVTLADLYTAVGTGNLAVDLSSDGVHPELSGYQKMAAGWLPAIKSVIAPAGTNAPPAIAAVEAREDLQHVKVKFSKPIDVATVSPANFSISGGVTVTAASLDVSARVVTLTTSPQTADSVHTLTVSSIGDLRSPQNIIASGSTETFTTRTFIDGSFELNDPAWVKTGTPAIVGTGSPKASDGTSLVVFNGGDSATGAIISQGIPTTAGRKYRMQFDMGVSASASQSQTLGLTVENGLVAPGTGVLLAQSETMSGIGGGQAIWRTVSVEFEAVSALTTVSFEDVSTSTLSVDLLLDDVRLEAVLNDAPVAEDDGSADTPFRTVFKNSGASAALAVLENDTDADSDPLTVTAAASPNGSVTISGDQKTLAFTPAVDFTGVTTITYVITDGQGNSASADAWISVVEPGTFINGSFEEGTGGALAGWTVVGSPGNPLDGIPFGFGTLLPNYFPDAGNGQRYAAFNGGTDDFGGSISQSFATTPGQTYSVVFDAGLAGGVGAKTQTLQAVVSGETNPPGSPRTWPLNSTGPVATWAEKSFTFVAGGSTTTLTFTDVSSGTAATFVDMLLDDVRVVPAIGVPVALNDGTAEAPFLTVAEDSGASGPVLVLANDSDPDSDPLTVTAASSPNGTVTINAGQTLSFTPALDFHGATTISYTIADGQDGTASATVFVSVTPVNDAPVAVAESYSTSLDTPITVPAAGVLANDTDVDGPLPLTAVLEVSPTHGTLTWNSDGGFTYAPTTGYEGPDSFTYRASDGSAQSAAAATVSITVGPPPLISNGSFEAGVPGELVGWNPVGKPSNPALGIPFSFGTLLPNYFPKENNGARYAVFNGGDDHFGGSISQQFATVVGQAYLVEFDAGLAGGVGNKTQTLQAGLSSEFNAPALPRTWPLTSTSAPAAWLPLGLNFTFVASSTLTTLTFTDVSAGSAAANVDMVLDNVRVTATGGGNQAPNAIDDGTPVPVTVAEDSGASAPINVLANDTDPDAGATLTVTAASSPNGSVAVNPDQTLTFTPALNFNGAATISYSISDGFGGSDSATVYLLVTPVNDAPLASAGSATVDEDGSVEITLAGSDVDAGDTLTYQLVTPALKGAVSITNAVATYTPNANANGADSFTFKANDGAADSSPALVSVTISPVNDNPVAVNDGSPETAFVSVAEDSSASAPITVLANDSDVESDPLTITAASSPNGAVSIISGQTLSFTPAADFNGATTIAYTISDGQGGTAGATAYVTVTPVNDDPVAADDGSAGSPLVSLAEDSGASAPITVLVNDSDVDFDPLSVTAASSPNGTVSIISGQTLSFTPAADFNGAATVSYTVSDGQGGTDNATLFVAVTAVNDDPVAVDDGSAVSPFLTVAEDSGASSAITVLGNDTDVDSDPLVVTAASSLNGTVSIIGGETLSFTPAADFSGATTISYTVSDGQGGTDSATVFVAVTSGNDAPVAEDDGSLGSPFLTVAEDSGASGPIAVLTNDTDADSDPLTITAASSPNGAVAIAGGETLGFTPAADFNGATTITYSISDGQGGTDSATVFVAVTPVNDPPTVAAASATTAEDTPVNITLSGTDIDAVDTLTYQVVGTPAHGSVSIAGNVATYTPAADFSGADSFTFKANDGTDDSSAATVSISVTPVNDPPVANDQAVTLAEDGSTLITLTGSDDEGASITYAVLGGPSHGTMRLNGAVATYTPDPDFNGQDSFFFIALTLNGIPQVSSIATVSITVTPVNDAPTVAAGSGTVNEDGSVEIPLAGSDVDAGDTLAYQVVAPPANGSVSIAGSVATYTPDADFNGTDGFTFKANDGLLDSPSAAPVSLTVNAVNDAPVAVNDGSAEAPLLAVAEDSSTSAPIAVLTNDSDVDTDPLTVITAASPDGAVAINGGQTLSFTPAADFNGVAAISYTISDGQGGTAGATAFVTVTPVNDAPVAVAGSATVNEDGSVNIQLAGTDVDAGASLTYQVVTPAASGSVNIVGAVATYTPNADFNGTDGFTFKANDGLLDSESAAAVSITVTPVNDAPVAVNDGSAEAPALTVAEDSGASAPVLVLVNDGDIDSDPLVITAAASANGAVDIVSGGTALSFTPATDFNGSTTITYTISDGQGGTAGATAFVTVTPVNDAPVAVAGTATVNEDGSVNIPLSGTDVDAGASLTYQVVTPAASGTVNIVGAVATYTPNADFNGTDGFTFKANDGLLDSASAAAVAITVNPVNDAPVAVNDGSAEAPLLAVAEDSSASAPIAVLTNDTDVDTDPLTVTTAASPNGTVDIISGQTLSFTPAPDFNGVAAISYAISDGQGGTAGATAFVTVTPVNDSPVAVNDGGAETSFVTVAEDSAASVPITVLANDTDVDSDPLAITTASSPNGTVAIVSGGTALSFTPGLNFNGATTISYAISDGQGGTAGATAFVTVTPVNDPPTVAGASATVNEDGSVNIPLVGNDIDGGDTLTYQMVAPASKGTVSISGAVATYTPNANANGADSFTFKANDGTDDSLPASVAINITPVDDAPVANAQSVSVNEDGSVVITLTGGDVDGDALFYTAASPANGGLVQSGASVTYTPNPNFNGADGFTFFVYSLPSGTPVFSALATVSITVNPVNDAPTASAGSATVNEDGSVNIPLSGNDIDAGDTLTYQLVASASKGTVNITGAVATYTPNPDANGADSFTFKASDGAAESSPALVSVSITALNDNPVAVNDGTAVSPILTVAEDSAASASITVLANDSDVDSDPLAITAASSPNGSVTINGGLTLSFAPAADFNGATTISYSISDGQGGTSDATAFVNVTPVNDNPVAVNDGSPAAPVLTVAEDSGASASITVLVNDSDVDSDPLAITAASSPNGTVAINGGLTLSFTPAADFNGPTTIAYSISDGQGGTADATAFVTVTPVNDAPTASPGTATAFEDIPVNIPLVASDIDAGDTLTYEVVTQAANGSVSVTGAVATYTPNGNFNGTDSFTFKAKDGSAESAPALVSISVNAMNDAPLAFGGTATVAEDGSVNIPLSGSDVDAGDTLTFIKTSGPLNGGVTITGAVATYTPNPDFNGSDVFTFKVSDGQSESPSAAITITVAAVNDAPVAVNDGSPAAPVLTVTENSGPSAPITVLANDSDLEGNPLTVIAANSPNGTVTINGDGTLVFTPAANFSGPATIGYTISDGQGGSASATVFVKVNANPVPDPNADPDGDSISNLVEYVIGGNPAGGQDAALLPTVTLASADLPGNPGMKEYLVFTYRRTDVAHTDPSVTIGVEWGSSLSGPWTAADGTHGEVPEVTDNGSYDEVKVYIPRSLAPDGKLFARLAVSITAP